mgnify:FL=1
MIGNGEMGRLTARAFRERGAFVTVTVRQYRSGQVQIPEGCARIHYGERYEKIPECRYVVSATSSPNLTLEKNKIQELNLTGALTLIDLAVPRDIDPCIGELPQTKSITSMIFRPEPVYQRSRVLRLKLQRHWWKRKSQNLYPGMSVKI